MPPPKFDLEHGPGESRFNYDEKKKNLKHVPLGDLIFLDRERCIQCARCTRFQDEIVDDPGDRLLQPGPQPGDHHLV